MTDDAVTRSRFGQWWIFFVLGVPILLPVIWWSVGLMSHWRPEATGFTKQLVTFEAQDLPLDEFLRARFSGCEIRQEADGGSPFSLKVRDMEEGQAMNWVAQLLDLHIDLTDGVITVRRKPWIEQHYDVVANWVRIRWRTDLWPNR